MNIQCGDCVRGLTPQQTPCERCKGTAVIEVREVPEKTVVEKAVSAVKKAVGKKK